MDALGQTLKPGDLVSWTNDYGTYIGIKMVTKIEETPGEELRYYLNKTDSPWFPVKGRNLIKVDLSDFPSSELDRLQVLRTEYNLHKNGVQK